MAGLLWRFPRRFRGPGIAAARGMCGIVIIRDPDLGRLVLLGGFDSRRAYFGKLCRLEFGGLKNA